MKFFDVWCVKYLAFDISAVDALIVYASLLLHHFHDVRVCHVDVAFNFRYKRWSKEVLLVENVFKEKCLFSYVFVTLKMLPKKYFSSV